MDVTKRSALQRHREKIVADIDVNDLVDDLFSKLVINHDDMDKIRAQNERKFKARCLLDIITQKGNEEYESFVNVLDKDYNWLAKDLKLDIGCVNEQEYDEELYCEALTMGDVPQLPLHYVRRTSELNNLSESLKELKRGHYVVLYGMTGSGKSVLAVSSVRNQDLIKNSFNNCMYFVNAGEAKTEMDVANLLYRLYIKLDDNYRKSLNLNIEFNKNGIAFMKYELQKLFLDPIRKEALLILDDVCSKILIDAFNFGCKTLVTTQNITLVPQKSIFIEINKGFKEAESLELFSKCAKLNVTELPIETKRIHDLCKGAPLVIALIASNLEKWKEDAKNKDRWSHYVNMLLDKKDGLAKAMQIFFRRKKEREQRESKGYLFNTIKHCVESMDEKFQEYYKHFALFVEDVNITPRVMEIILEKNKYEVEDIVSELQNKSLIVCAYNVELKCYVYGIHDLLLAHLKASLKPEEKVQLHDKLVRNYLEVSKNNFANLPNDNYIFTYIGYHLLEAQRFEDFPNVYFDLNFIGAKIKAVGIASLVGDFVRYRKYITKNNDPELSKKLDIFESFVQKYGQDLHKYPDTDIIQCGLQQPLTSEVHEAAVHIAQKQCDDTLYLQTQFFGQTVYVTHTLDLKEDVCATCFAHQTNTILVGTSSGEIHLWDHSYKSKLRTFTGHTQKIFYLQLSPDADKFLSVSEDGSVKIWSLVDACIKSSGNDYDENGFNMHTPTPRNNQKFWVDFFGETVKIDRSNTFIIPDDFITTASFSNDNDHVVVGSQNGIVKAWNLQTVEEVFQVKRDDTTPITCVTFSLKNNVILFSCENVILVYDFEKREYLSQFMNDVRTTSLLVVPYSETKIVAISDKSVTIWVWKQRDIKRGGVCVYEPESYVLDSREDAHYICGAVTWDGVYLVAGSSDHCINMWNIETKEKVKEMTEHHGLVVSLDTFLNEDNSSVMYILLSGSDNKTVKQWHIREVENHKTKTKKLLPEFSTCWNHGHGSNPLIAAVNSDNQVQVFSGHALISESEALEQPKCLSFSPCGAQVAIGLNSGIVMIFDFRNKKYNAVMNLEDAVKYIEYFEDDCCRILVAASENTCLMTYKDGESVRFKSPATKSMIDEGKVSRTIKCFPIPEIKRIFSVEENGSIKIWYFNGIENVLVAKEPDATVTMAAVSHKKDLIALAFSDKNFRVYDIEITEDNVVKCFYNQGKYLDEIPRSCCFSKDGKLLALGQDSGNIVLWSIENKTQLSTLKLHKSWVRNLAFSPAALPGAPLILVSVGDQIAWWDITYVYTKSTEKILRSSRGRRSMRFSDPGALTIDTTSTVALMDDCWVGKKGRPGRFELLSAIKLAGVHALDVAISPRFTCFVTVDASGLLYIMNVLRPATT